AAVALHQHRAGGATRQRLQSQCAAAGEQVQHPRTGQRRHQPVEQGLADAIGGRAQAGDVGHRQPRAAPAAADDPHHPGSGGGTGTRTRRHAAAHGRGRRRPVSKAVTGCSASMCAILRYPCEMVSFFRRKKPESAPATPSGSRFSAEELAAAFPQAPSAPAPAEAPVVPEPLPDAPQQPASEGAVDQAAGATTVEPAAVVDQAVAVEAAVVPADAGTPVEDGAAVGPAAAPGRTGWRERLRNSAFARSFGGLFSRNPKLDDDLLDEIETALLTADVGVAATTALVESLRKRMKAREFADSRALLAALRAELVAMLQPVSQP